MYWEKEKKKRERKKEKRKRKKEKGRRKQKRIKGERKRKNGGKDGGSNQKLKKKHGGVSSDSVYFKSLDFPWNLAF